jgi:hypothetical protein
MLILFSHVPLRLTTGILSYTGKAMKLKILQEKLIRMIGAIYSPVISP